MKNANYLHFRVKMTNDVSCEPKINERLNQGMRIIKQLNGSTWNKQTCKQNNQNIHNYSLKILGDGSIKHYSKHNKNLSSISSLFNCYDITQKSTEQLLQQLPEGDLRLSWLKH